MQSLEGESGAGEDSKLASGAINRLLTSVVPGLSLLCSSSSLWAIGERPFLPDSALRTRGSCFHTCHNRKSNKTFDLGA